LRWPLGLCCKAILSGDADVTKLSEDTDASVDSVLVASDKAAPVEEYDGCALAALVGRAMDVAVQVAPASCAVPDVSFDGDFHVRVLSLLSVLASVYFGPGDVSGDGFWGTVLKESADGVPTNEPGTARNEHAHRLLFALLGIG
jgi:hypothetical protein